jgi:hypothetical protein
MVAIQSAVSSSCRKWEIIKYLHNFLSILCVTFMQWIWSVISVFDYSHQTVSCRLLSIPTLPQSPQHSCPLSATNSFHAQKGALEHRRFHVTVHPIRRCVLLEIWFPKMWNHKSSWYFSFRKLLIIIFKNVLYYCDPRVMRNGEWWILRSKQLCRLYNSAS